MRTRIAALYYKVRYLDKTQIVSAAAPEASFSLSGFECTVNPERLTARPVDDHPDEASARASLEPALRAWEATTELIDGYPISFTFEQSQEEVIDPEPNTTYVMAGVAMVAVTVLEATATIERGTFPLPKDNVQHVGELTTLLRTRWRNVAQGRELTTSGAYFVFTTLKKHFGGPDKIASALAVSGNVVDLLSRLASTEDPEHGRKAGGRPGSLTQVDLEWMKATCRELITRVMQVEAGVQDLPPLKLDDLPPRS